ncbi:MAG: hypothetical protein EHM24_32595, partial [Acidobacteria bacterium]
YVPAVLSRGYARPRPLEGAVVVSDGARVRADLDRSGDEPLMLARRLPGAGVFVAADRYLAGRLAERRFGATVHILDDGFQHMGLARDAEIVIVSVADVIEGAVLPFGRLREPLEALSRAGAIVIAPEDGEDAGQAERAILKLHAGPVFRLRRATGVPRFIDSGLAVDGCGGLLSPQGGTGGRGSATAARGRKAIAVAGIAVPERFTGDLRRAGWEVAAEVLLGDHEPVTAGLLARIERSLREAGAEVVLTTEKDAARMLPHRPLRMPVAFVPLEVRPEPEAAFRGWLAGRVSEPLAAARADAQDLRMAIGGRQKAGGKPRRGAAGR